jgi:hypothetical protein
MNGICGDKQIPGMNRMHSGGSIPGVSPQGLPPANIHLAFQADCCFLPQRGKGKLAVGSRGAATHGDVEAEVMKRLSGIEGPCRGNRMSGVRIRWRVLKRMRRDW